MSKIMLLSLNSEIWASGICSILERAGHQASLAQDVNVFQRRAQLQKPDLVLVDGRLPTEFWEAITSLWPSKDMRPQLILLTQPNQVDGNQKPPVPVDAWLHLARAQDLVACVGGVLDRVPMESMPSETDGQGLLGSLSPREQEVASLIRRGLRNKEVARLLNLSEGTVKMHLHHVFSKTGLRNRTQLILHMSGVDEKRPEGSVEHKSRNFEIYFSRQDRLS